MKIDNDKPNILSGATDPLSPMAPAGPASAANQSATPTAKADRATFSAEARLLKAATDAATAEPGVRAELIERMRALLNQGEIGEDAARLADAIIDDVLNDK